jgi:hypothetical protein
VPGRLVAVGGGHLQPLPGGAEKGRGGCGEAHRKCVQRCEGGTRSACATPRALDCDNAQESCGKTCDKARSACFTSKEKAFLDCRLKEARKR